MRSKIFQEVLDDTPKDVEIFVRLYSDLVVRINHLLKEKGYTQAKLAEKLDKKPSEIHKWLRGEHNFTLRSIAKLQAELGEVLLVVPSNKPNSGFQKHSRKTTYKVEIYIKNRGEVRVEDWSRQQKPMILGNVGNSNF